MAKSYWTNKKHKKEKWIGRYERDLDGERVFTLRNQPKGTSLSGFRKITFESWQAAKEAGWKKVLK